MNRGRRSGGWLPVQAGNARAPSANQQAALHSLWEKAPGYVPAHRGGWDEFPSAPAADAADGFRSGPSALGAAQDAGEAAQRRAFLKWTQGEAMTAREKAFVEDLWNTDPAKASEYWAAGEFLSTEVPKQKISAGQPFDESTDFYIAPNGKILAREYKNWIGTNMRDTIIKKIEDKELYNIFNQLYRPGSIIGDGGTADVIRFEKETGLLLSKSGHRQKGIDMLKYFRRLIERKELSQSDMEIVQKIISDLENVI